jgi:hypothetical protein
MPTNARTGLPHGRVSSDLACPGGRAWKEGLMHRRPGRGRPLQHRPARRSPPPGPPAEGRPAGSAVTKRPSPAARAKQDPSETRAIARRWALSRISHRSTSDDRCEVAVSALVRAPTRIWERSVPADPSELGRIAPPRALGPTSDRSRLQGRRSSVTMRTSRVRLASVAAGPFRGRCRTGGRRGPALLAPPRRVRAG